VPTLIFNKIGFGLITFEINFKGQTIRAVSTQELNMRAPVIEEPLESSYVVREGERVVLGCQFEDVCPRADVVWLKNGQPIDLNLMGLAKDFKVE
jgi:hypothetical protein